jgi:phosphate acetyltransferase/phosphate butyryltransferase
MEPARDLAFEDIQVGSAASFERTVTTSDIESFAALSGDFNPLHTDPAYASQTNFQKPIAQGMFLGALCSALVGMHLPGKRCLYLSQSLAFRNPVFADDTLLVEGKITAKSESFPCARFQLLGAKRAASQKARQRNSHRHHDRGFGSRN